MTIETPWGPAQDTNEIAPGIVSYSTAGHGGIRLSAERAQLLCETLPDFETFAGGTWFEEDCDAAVVVLIFWQHFTPAAIRAAVNIAGCKFLGGRGWPSVREWINSDAPHAVSLRATVARFEADNADMWERGSMGSVPDLPRAWRIWFTRVRDGARHEAIFEQYPMQQFYTDAELERLSVKAVA